MEPRKYIYNRVLLRSYFFLFRIPSMDVREYNILQDQHQSLRNLFRNLETQEPRPNPTILVSFLFFSFPSSATRPASQTCGWSVDTSLAVKYENKFKRFNEGKRYRS